MNTAVEQSLRHLAREDASRVVALLAKRFGDLDFADDAVQDGLLEAARTWPANGVPANPAGWLHQVARRKAIDRLRRSDVQRRRVATNGPELIALASDADETDSSLIDDSGFDPGDERLRLLLLCCHPALELDVQVALTLRLVSGLTTEEIALAFLVATPTLAQRISRAKRKIRMANIAMSLPAPHCLASQQRCGASRYRLGEDRRALRPVVGHGAVACRGAQSCRRRGHGVRSPEGIGGGGCDRGARRLSPVSCHTRRTAGSIGGLGRGHCRTAAGDFSVSQRK